MAEDSGRKYRDAMAERFGPEALQGATARAFAAPIMVTCPYCRESLVLTLNWWLNGLGDVWGTGQIGLHVCSSEPGKPGFGQPQEGLF